MMNNNTADYTESQIAAVGYVIVIEHDKTTAEGWNRGAAAAVVADLLAAGRTLPEILAAGLAAAADPDARTPKAIGFDRYRPTSTGTGAASPAHDVGPRCHECGFIERKHATVVGNGSYFPHPFRVETVEPSSARRFHLGDGDRS